MRYICVVTGLIVATAIASAVFSSRGRRAGENAASRAALQCAIQTPGDDGVLFADSYEKVEVTWLVSNTSNEAIHGLRALVSCGCDVIDDIPSSLQPGETASVSFRVRAPAAGLAEREIPVVCLPDSRRVGVLRARIHAKVSPPLWIAPPKSVRILAVQGQKSLHKVVWECVENIDSEPIIDQVKLSPELDGIGSSMQVTTEPWGVNADLVKRRYGLELQVELDSARTLSGNLIVSSASASVTSPLEWQATVKPALSAFPNQVDLLPNDIPPEPAIVTVVSRIEGAIPVATTFEKDVLSVTPVAESREACVRKFVVEIEDPGKFSGGHEITFSAGPQELIVPIHRGK
jgi:hypothetical protein